MLDGTCLICKSVNWQNLLVDLCIYVGTEFFLPLIAHRHANGVPCILLRMVDKFVGFPFTTKSS
jgi:hypothetical protein